MSTTHATRPWRYRQDDLMHEEPAGPHPGTAPHAARVRIEQQRRGLLAGAAVLAPLLLAAAFLVLPQDVPDGSAAVLARVAEDPDRWYAGHLVFAIGLALLSAVAVATAAVVRQRSGTLATLGAMVLIVGSSAFSTAMFMVGGVTHLIATDAALTGGAGLAFQDAADDSGRLGLPFPIGFFGIVVGIVLCALALGLSRALPWWQAAAIALLPLAIGVGFDSSALLGAALCLVVAVGVLGIARALLQGVTPAESGGT